MPIWPHLVLGVKESGPKLHVCWTVYYLRPYNKSWSPNLLKILDFSYRFASKFCHWTLRQPQLSLLFPWSLPCPGLAFPSSMEKLCCALKSSCHGHVSLWALCTQSHRVKPFDCTNAVPSSKIYRLHCKGGNWYFILQFHLLKPCNRQKLLSNCNWLDEMMTIAFPLPCE